MPGDAVSSSLRLVPVDLVAARKFVSEHHRHNLPPQGGKFAVGLQNGSGLVGVGIAGRPVARMLDDGLTLEIIRTCTTNVANSNSMIYGALCRAAKALGYKRIFTYTLQEETGASLKAANFTLDASLKGEASWSRPSRPRVQVDLFGNERRPSGPKFRWVREL